MSSSPALLRGLAAILLAQTASAATYYVAKTGNDLHSGTSTNQAFLTIQKAASLMNAGDTCYVLSGTYRETVTPAHSGTSNAPITFASYPGAVPIVSGADVLNLSWNVYTGSIYQASSSLSFRQLFVDGQMMNEARWPNAVVDELLYAPRATPQTCTYTDLVDSSLPSINLVGAMLHIFPNEYRNPGYAANTRQITGWDPATKEISWSGNIFNTNGVNTFYYLYGTLPLLDIATEWVLTGGVLYLWTPDSASPASHVVEAKTRSSAFTLDNLSYVTVSGINVFAAGTSMANTTNCVVDNCNLIYVQHDTTADWYVSVPIANQVSGSGSTWRNSTINFSSQDGIRCTGQNEVVSNCVILNVDYYPGTYYASVTAFSGGNGTRVVNNTFRNSGRYLVGVASPSADVGYNDLGYGELLTSDGGGTYVYLGGGNGAGTAIHHNWVHNSWTGVYVDALQNNYFVYRNVCWSNYVGMLFNHSTNNLIINNTTISNTSADIQFSGGTDAGVQFINNFWHTTAKTYGSTVVSNNGYYPPLGTNYVPQTGSGAIDGGIVYSPYTDGYVGAAPDIGAYEAGGAYWIPGANFSPPPFPNPYAVLAITTQPASQTCIAAQTATFTVAATGLPPLSYQWLAGLLGGPGFTNLTAGGQFSGVTNATLYITDVMPANALYYLVVVTNTSGSVTSAIARLTVLTNSAYQQTILADRPVSYWPLNETSGTVIHDLAGTNYGTCINPGGLTLGGPGILYNQGLTSDKAIYFTNTSSGYVKVPYSGTLNTPAFTVETWLNMPVFPVSGAGADMDPLSFDDSNPKGWTFEIAYPNGANPNMYGWLGFNNTWTRLDSGTCIQGQWSYYALTYDGTAFTIYTNGVPAASAASSYTQVSALHSLYLGAYDSGGTVTRFYTGGMENVAFYNKALMPSQILNHYQVGSTGIPPAPPTLSLQRSGTNLVVGWISGFLQSSGAPAGPWSYVSNAVSPYTSVPTNAAAFFRATLQAPP